MNPCEPSTGVREFAFAKIGELLATMTDALNLAAARPDEEAVHDMRVSIRRLQQALRLFEQYLPKNGVKRIRKAMKRVMERAGELRNYDIALSLAAGAASITALLSEQRGAAEQALIAVLQEFADPELGSRWRELLKLGRV